MLEATKTRREAWLNGNAGSSSTNSDEGSWKYLWKIKVPAKFKVFLWLVYKKIIHPRDSLLKRGWKGESNCVFCGKDEPVDQLFITT